MAKPVVLFLHGWPEDHSTFAGVIARLSDDYDVAAIDLPGIGCSRDVAPSHDKRTLARLIARMAADRGWRDLTLVGHDVGGMIVYAYLREYPDTLARAVIMNTVVPGIEPWSLVNRNPHIWHFAFHAVPELPELLVGEHVARYFDFFYDALAHRPEAVSTEARNRYTRAYERTTALHTGFEWYRAFEQDAKDNIAFTGSVRTPVLYIRGDHESGDIQEYLDGLRASGLHDLRGALIAECGHFAPDEQPDAVARAIRDFMAAGLAPAS